MSFVSSKLLFYALNYVSSSIQEKNPHPITPPQKSISQKLKHHLILQKQMRPSKIRKSNLTQLTRKPTKIKYRFRLRKQSFCSFYSQSQLLVRALSNENQLLINNLKPQSKRKNPLKPNFINEKKPKIRQNSIISLKSLKKRHRTNTLKVENS